MSSTLWICLSILILIMFITSTSKNPSLTKKSVTGKDQSTANISENNKPSIVEFSKDGKAITIKNASGFEIYPSSQSDVNNVFTNNMSPQNAAQFRLNYGNQGDEKYTENNLVNIDKYLKDIFNPSSPAPANFRPIPPEAVNSTVMDDFTSFGKFVNTSSKEDNDLVLNTIIEHTKIPNVNYKIGDLFDYGIGNSPNHGPCVKGTDPEPLGFDVGGYL